MQTSDEKLEKAEDALRESEETYRRMVEKSVVGFFQVNAKGRFIRVNPAYADMLGYQSPNELISLASDIADQCFVNPDDHQRFLQRLLKEGTVKYFEFKAKCRDGSQIWIANSAQAYFNEDEKIDHYDGTAFDITRHKLVEKELRQSEERFRNLIEGSIQGVLIHRNHKPLFVNQTWASIHGYSPEAVLRMDTIVPLISPKDQKRMLEFKEARLQGKEAPLEYEYQGVHKNGSLIWLDNRVRVVRWGGLEAIQTTIFDISRRKRVEAEREKLISELQTAVSEIKQLSGLLPICSMCKKIRDDKGYWNQIESYIEVHSNAQFSHGICRECAEKYYPDLDLYSD